MANDDLPAVRSMTASLQELLQIARTVKPTDNIEPPLVLLDFGGRVEKIGRTNIVSADSSPARPSQVHSSQDQYAVIETSVRNIFNDLLSSTSIDDPSFTQIWNLLDIVSMLSDNEQCEPGLIFWLVEELLDSQTIDGCRIVFDYLESRRERITAKHFSKKNLIILRSCNELLRRLSRAEDTVFCGRVFIFLFQSFPLGDKSSVNLRGEYHVENTTTFDTPLPKDESITEHMDVDPVAEKEDQASGAQDQQAAGGQEPPESMDGDKTAKVSVITPKDPPESVDIDSLYPIFWSLQQYFSNPTKLFDADDFGTFRAGLRLTLIKFKEAQATLDSRGTAKVTEESRRGIKRKRVEGDEEFASGFNPKYLTSRDLFELEISDLAFRRHILVQALILLEFLLSLTAKAKGRLAELTLQNKSVLYQFTLGEEDAKWASDTRSAIAAYLQDGPEGKFYYRMVDTVLSRDKNWVRWKAENCPPIERAPLSSQEVLDARVAADKACAPRRLRATPLGSLDLSFLSEAENITGLEKLKRAARYFVPDPKSFEAPIVEDEFDIGMAKTDEDRQLSVNAKASKTWRALRIASKNRLNLFDKIDTTSQSLRALFEPEPEPEADDGGKVAEDGGKGGADVKMEGSLSAEMHRETSSPKGSAAAASAPAPATGPSAGPDGC